MISEGQLKNVISYYFMDMMEQDSLTVHVPTHITRDTIQFNKSRAEICGKAYNKTKYKNILSVIHDSVNVKQVNSVPNNTSCAVDNVSIPLNESGIQLICQSESNKITHVVLQKKYQTFCNSYFKLRHFDSILQEEIRQFFLKQPWYVPGVYQTYFLLKKLFASTFVMRVYKDLQSIVEILDGS